MNCLSFMAVQVKVFLKSAFSNFGDAFKNLNRFFYNGERMQIIYLILKIFGA